MLLMWLTLQSCPDYVLFVALAIFFIGVALAVLALLLLKKGFDFGSLVVFVNFVGLGRLDIVPYYHINDLLV